MSYSTGVRHKEGVTQEGPMSEERLTEDLLARDVYKRQLNRRVPLPSRDDERFHP